MWFGELHIWKLRGRHLHRVLPEYRKLTVVETWLVGGQQNKDLVRGQGSSAGHG